MNCMMKLRMLWIWFWMSTSVLTEVACRTKISIFTSKTFTRLYVTTTIFTWSWAGQVTALSVIYRFRTSYGINDIFCFKHFEYIILQQKINERSFVCLLFSLKLWMASFIAWSLTVYMKKINQTHINIKTDSWMKRLLLFVILYSFPYAMIIYLLFV